MNIAKIRKEWEHRLNVGQIKARHPDVTAEQLHAILFHSDGLTVRQIKKRTARLTDGMKAAEIAAAMRTP